MVFEFRWSSCTGFFKKKIDKEFSLRETQSLIFRGRLCFYTGGRQSRFDWMRARDRERTREKESRRQLERKEERGGDRQIEYLLPFII